MSDPLEFRWADPGSVVDQLAYPDGVTAAEVLDGLLRVTGEDGRVAWEGRMEDPGSQQ